MNDEPMKRIEAVLEEEKQKAYLNGIAEGHRSAQRILIWWQFNHTLIKPVPIEKLIEWSDNELAKLKEKLS